MEQFWTIFWSAVGVALTGLFSWLSIVITNFFNSKIKDTKMAQHANMITKIVMDAVQCITQTYVGSLKAEGKFDEKAQKEAKERAMAIIRGQLTVELKEYITSNFGDIESYIANKVEAVIYQSKK